MKRLLVAALLLSGCAQYEARDQEAAFKIWDKNTTGRQAERCAKMRTVADAWAEAGDEQKFQEWQSRSSMPCFRAQIEP